MEVCNAPASFGWGCLASASCLAFLAGWLVRATWPQTVQVSINAPLLTSSESKQEVEQSKKVEQSKEVEQSCPTGLVFVSSRGERYHASKQCLLAYGGQGVRQLSACNKCIAG